MNVTAQAGDTLFVTSGSMPLSLAATKQALRQQLRRQRQRIPSSTRRRAERSMLRTTLRCITRRRARRVAVYASIGSEAATGHLIAALPARRIEVFLPSLRRNSMCFRRLAGGPLRQHAFGMREPRAGTPWRASAMDVVIVPLLGFDAHGMRLGQGGGYYDRALAANRFRPYRLGLAFHQQGVATLPREPWDQPLHAVATERGLQKFPRQLFGKS